jgi:hypothetical protein
MIEAQNRGISCKSASKCSETDYNRFCIAEDQLTIELISEESLQNWRKIFDTSHKDKLAAIPNHGAEVRCVQPLTKQCLQKRLLWDDVKTVLSFGEQVGFHSKEFKVHGFVDKASCPAGSNPDGHRPGSSNVRGFHSPVILTGSWEDKGLNVPLGHSQTAQLFSSIGGFVEGARHVFNIQFQQFGGILTGVQTINGQNVLVCKCALWFITSGGDIARQTSKLFQTEHEVASGIEWWIGQSVIQLRFWQREYSVVCASHLKASPLDLIAPVGSIEESGSGHPQREGIANGNYSALQQGNAPDTRQSSHFCTKGLRLDIYIVSVKSKELNVANQTQRWLLSSTIGNRRT